MFGVEEKVGRFINCFAVAILKFKMAAIFDLIRSLSPQRVVLGKLLQSACESVLCMRHISILKNINMSRTVTHVDKIHQPVLHGHGQPPDRVSCHQHSAVDKIKGAILDHSNTFVLKKSDSTM